MKTNKIHQNQFSHTTQQAFSMIELIFVIVILGILASIAIPKLSLTRSDAQYTAIMADTQVILNSIQQKFILEDLDTKLLNGNLIMQTAGLSYVRWIPTATGVRLAKNNTIDTKNNCLLIDFKNTHLILSIDPKYHTPLCQKLYKAYPQAIDIHLENSTIKF